MKKIAAVRVVHHNRPLQLDLLTWRPTPSGDASRISLRIAKRFGLSTDHAGTIARLAGIGGSRHES
jgi:hypothetical protein